MDDSILQFIQVSSFAPVAMLFVWKVLIPLTNLLVAKVNHTDTSAQARLNKIEGNDLHDIEYFKDKVKTIERGIIILEDQVKDFSSFQKVCLDAQVIATEKFGEINGRLATLEERTRGK